MKICSVNFYRVHYALTMIIITFLTAVVTFTTASVPNLASFATDNVPVSVCPTNFTIIEAPACAGYHNPQIAGMVPGDNATLCFHLGCCYYLDEATKSEHCVEVQNATASSGTWRQGCVPS